MGCTDRCATTRERASGAPAAAGAVHTGRSGVSSFSSKHSTTNMTFFCISAEFCRQGVSLNSLVDYA